MANDTSGAHTSRRRRAFGSAAGIVLAFVAVAGVILWMRGDGESNDPGESVQLGIGDAAPAFSLPGADGRLYSLNDLVVQKKVLLYFSMGPG